MRVWGNALLVKSTQVQFTVNSRSITNFCTFSFRIFNALSLSLWAHISDPKKHTHKQIENKDLNPMIGVQNERVCTFVTEIPNSGSHRGLRMVFMTSNLLRKN